MPVLFSRFPQSDFPQYFNGDARQQIQAIRDHLFITVAGGKRSATMAPTNQ